jgi:Protein of unknown function (DUF3137)
MAADNNFKQFYDSELHDLLQPLETERQSVKKLAVLTCLLFVAAVIAFIITSSSHSGIAGILTLILFLGGIIAVVRLYYRKKSYVSKYKETIVRKIIHFIDPSFQYNPGGHISRTDYDASGLFIEKPERFKGDDYIEGKRDKTFFCFSELHTEHKVGSGKNAHWETIFKGLFFIGDFNKHFQGRTYVWSERNPQLNFLNKLFSSFAWDLAKVKLESSEFENRFIVYSTDQVEARYILTPSFMERLSKLQDMMGQKTAFSFVNTNIYVAVPIKDDLFEPSVFSANDYNTISDYYNTVQMVLGIIDELKLNQRLWTKE